MTDADRALLGLRTQRRKLEQMRSRVGHRCDRGRKGVQAVASARRQGMHPPATCTPATCTLPPLQLQTCITEQVATARQQVAVGQRSQALFTLKRKRLQEYQLGRLDGWILNVEEMVSCFWCWHAPVSCVTAACAVHGTSCEGWVPEDGGCD